MILFLSDREGRRTNYRDEDDAHGQEGEQHPGGEEGGQGERQSSSPGDIVLRVHESIVSHSQDGAEASISMDPVLVIRHWQLGHIAVLADLCISNIVTNDSQKNVGKGKDGGEDGMDLVLVTEEEHGFPAGVVPEEVKA